MNENGQAVCSTDLPFGSFYLKELSTDSHYLLNAKPSRLPLSTAGLLLPW